MTNRRAQVTNGLRHLLRTSGAVAAQLSAALASLVLQLLVARTLGSEDLGRYAMLYGGLVLAAALATGFVGDSLTVLDRGVRTVRAGLQLWCLAISLTAAALAGGVTGATGYLSWRLSAVFAFVTLVFVVREVLRRLLMATLHFWRIVIVDVSSLVVSVGVLIAGSALMTLTLGTFLVAMLVGLASSTVVAVVLVPASERWLAPRRPANMAFVARFGGWRAAQQCVRPGTLTAARIEVIVAAGPTSFGRLEAARLFMAPAQLVVSGLGSFLLSTYARDKDKPVRLALRTADRAAIGLMVFTVALGVLGTALAPTAGQFITGGSYELDRVAVFGWSLFAAAAAAVMPYASLAAVRGHQAIVFALKLLEALVALSAVAALVWIDPSLAPYGLALGPLLAGIAVRQRVLLPLIQAERNHRMAQVRMGA